MPCHILQKAQEPLQAAAEAVGLRLRPLDKKAEKALAQAQQDDLTAQLADQSDPAAVLSLVVPLLVMQVRNYPVHASAACDCDAHCRPPPQRSSVLHTTARGLVNTMVETFCNAKKPNWRSFCHCQRGPCACCTEGQSPAGLVNNATITLVPQGA